MEKKANTKIINYIDTMRLDLINKLNQNINNQTLIEYIQRYPSFCLDSEDFTKRKRVKNKIPLSDRCCAKRADGGQCTRRKKNDTDNYCGTHMKGTPHGTMNVIVSDFVGIKKEVWVEEIGGIMYYLDNKNNVYSAEDIMSNQTNPKIIAKWRKNVNNDYEICS